LGQVATKGTNQDGWKGRRLSKRKDFRYYFSHFQLIEMFFSNNPAMQILISTVVASLSQTTHLR
jgi:hypothetical protein